MKRFLGLMVSVLAGLAGCTATDDMEPQVLYDDPDAPFPEEFTYRCPDFEAEDWQCPFQDEPQEKVVFSGPAVLSPSDAYDPRHYDYGLFYDTLRLIDSVPPGARLKATTYYFTMSPWGRAVREALVCAAERGVLVHILVGDPVEPTLDGDVERQTDTEDTVFSLQSQSMIRPRLDVHRCLGGCLMQGGRFDGKQHSKFFAIDRVCNGDGWDEHVIAVSSNNWTSSLVKRDNATLVKRNDAKLHGAFVAYYDQMVAAEKEGQYISNYYDAPDGDSGFLGHGSGDDPNFGFHLFPRSGGGDPVESFLTEVDCRQGGEIRVAMSRWTMFRANLVDQLAALATSGCRVQLILGDEPTEHELRKYLVGTSWNLIDAPFEYRRLPSSTFHDKYLMIDGTLDGKTTRWVWTGSHNFSRSSLHTNEETALTVEDGDLDGDGLADNTIYQDFLDHFEWQWARAGTLGAFPIE